MHFRQRVRLDVDATNTQQFSAQSFAVSTDHHHHHILVVAAVAPNHVSATRRLRSPACLPEPISCSQPRQAQAYNRYIPCRRPVRAGKLDVPGRRGALGARPRAVRRSSGPAARACHVRRLGARNLLAARHARHQPHRQGPRARRGRRGRARRLARAPRPLHRLCAHGGRACWERRAACAEIRHARLPGAVPVLRLRQRLPERRAHAVRHRPLDFTEHQQRVRVQPFDLGGRWKLYNMYLVYSFYVILFRRTHDALTRTILTVTLAHNACISPQSHSIDG